MITGLTAPWPKNMIKIFWSKTKGMDGNKPVWNYWKNNAVSEISIKDRSSKNLQAIKPFAGSNQHSDSRWSLFHYFKFEPQRHQFSSGYNLTAANKWKGRVLFGGHDPPLPVYLQSVTAMFLFPESLFSAFFPICIGVILRCFFLCSKHLRHILYGSSASDAVNSFSPTWQIIKKMG